MKAHRWIGVAMLALAPQVLAFDDSDVGAYQAIDPDGELTQKIFRVLKKPEGWRVEERQPDASWLDVTCQGGCPLKEATNSEIEQFFQARTPSNVTNHCLRNQIFAFCRIERTSPGQVEVGHALVVIQEDGPIALRLRSLGRNGEMPPGEDDAAGKGKAPAQGKGGGDKPDSGDDAPAEHV